MMSHRMMKMKLAYQMEDQAIKDLEKDIFEDENEERGAKVDGNGDDTVFVDAKGTKVVVSRHSNEIEAAQKELEAKKSKGKGKSLGNDFTEKLANQKAGQTAKEAAKLKQRLQDREYDDIR